MRMDELAPLNDSKYKRDPAWAGSATLFYHIAGKNQPALGQDAGQTHFLFPYWRRSASTWGLVRTRGGERRNGQGRSLRSPSGSLPELTFPVRLCPQGKAGRCRASGTRQDVFAFICAVSALLGRTPIRRFDVFSKLLPGKGTKQPPGFRLECSGGGLAPLSLRQVPFTAWTELWVLNPSQGSPGHMLQHQGGTQEDHCGQQCQQGHNDVRLLFGHGILLTFRCF